MDTHAASRCRTGLPLGRVVSCMKPRDTDFALYCESNLVERFFSKINHYRAIANCFDKRASTFVAEVPLVCVLIRFN